jgi:ketosteroid isomerase-like protein
MGSREGVMEARQAIEKINAEFSEAYNRGDAAAVSAAYVEDGAVLAPDEPTVRGKRAIEGTFQEAIKGIGGRASIETVEVVAAGDMAYQWANYSLKAGKISVAGKFVEVYNRQADGSWKIRLTIFNTDHPLSGAN